jgi:hypothetical protein
VNVQTVFSGVPLGQGATFHGFIQRSQGRTTVKRQGRGDLSKAANRKFIGAPKLVVLKAFHYEYEMRKLLKNCSFFGWLDRRTITKGKPFYRRSNGRKAQSIREARFTW